MHLSYGEYITVGEITKDLKKMTREEDEDGLFIMKTMVEFLELMVLTRGVYSSFEMHDLNGDQTIDREEAADAGFISLIDKFESNSEEGWDINEYKDFVMANEDAAQREFNAAADVLGWDMYQKDFSD